MQVRQILETALYVSDLARAEDFYRRVLGLVPFSREEGRHLFFRCGGGVLLLFNPEKTKVPSGEAPPHGSRGQGHVAFSMREEERESWLTHLRDQNVSIEKEVRWPRGGYSIYFRDPEGNSLELATPSLWGLANEGIWET